MTINNNKKTSLNKSDDKSYDINNNDNVNFDNTTFAKLTMSECDNAIGNSCNLNDNDSVNGDRKVIMIILLML